MKIAAPGNIANGTKREPNLKKMENSPMTAPYFGKGRQATIKMKVSAYNGSSAFKFLLG